VTRFWFRDLPPAPAEAHLLNHAWNWSDLDEKAFASLVTAYGGFFEANSDPGSPYAGLFALLHLTQNSSPTSQVVLTASTSGATRRTWTRSRARSVPGLGRRRRRSLRSATTT
jgi:aclacinomycin oxidase